jgi:hypothetical protein
VRVVQVRVVRVRVVRVRVTRPATAVHGSVRRRSRAFAEALPPARRSANDASIVTEDRSSVPIPEASTGRVSALSPAA